MALVFAYGLPAEGLAKDLAVVEPVTRCEGLSGSTFAVGTDPVRITAAKVNGDNSASPFCEVTGYVAPQVRFAIKLPLKTWRQRMLFLGCGGFCGGVGTRAWAMANCQPYERGEFAVVYSDLGHTAVNSDAVWASGNPQGIRDFGSRGVHVVQLAARNLIDSFYRQPPKYSYFSGCSDGGREALMSAQRYPRDFDGIVAGAPAANMTMNNSIYHGWLVQHLLSPDRQQLVDDSQLLAVQAEAIRQCDGLDGRVDQVIGNPGKCHPNLERLSCPATSQLVCLTPQQIGLVQALYAGPSDAKGRLLYHGVPPGSEYSWGRQVRGSAEFAFNFTSFMTGAVRPEARDVWKLGYTPADLKRYNFNARELNALDPDLGAFNSGGGKLLVWHGSADSSIPPGSSSAYIEAVRKRMGVAKANEFLRFYLVPGMAHCTPIAPGPTAVNFLDPLMQWVEDGIAPNSIPAWSASGAADWNLKPYVSD
ncbi:tannase/feruloyl esterase family alpha/beta hydrolase [Novosphingobium sp.]|uniref:tannase/feruloyl esterase family alpha/beta hydrolase n=1 Tax=Novosphingobium sp. TaxID=1874826 RepID=UPI00286DF099|nr:tannase/feruloyl esterase family alpha/beta hydrolase [Novosphingobium sp.]